ncbi:hypothetical protein SAMN06265173_1458 [Thalassovita litoralis]|jgi:hypothetical protein|uniref:Uncharacterized protein n=1 Tax=Thalassovita litoralis TaxID=1010611 RepID=A0A521FQW5_9RHOB|nr:hypothetical protein [Thalassovita litoralis]SMO98589.1 hypothetical protein SAMN06265173_1458 [Thalassovita litoralis]
MPAPDIHRSDAAHTLALGSVNARGRALGLQPEDRLIAIGETRFAGDTTNLSARFHGPSPRPQVLWFQRDGAVWPVQSQTAHLGRWRQIPMSEDDIPGDFRGKALQNWSVVVDADGRYDALPQHPTALAFLVPFHLIRMRLWGALLLWLALCALSVPLGWMAGLPLQALIWLYFWRSSPGLAHEDRIARGFRPWRVVAAHNETDLHRRMAALAPTLRFIHSAVPPPNG